MDTTTLYNTVTWGLMALNVSLSGCAQNADLFGGALGQNLPPMPANQPLPHYPPLELVGVGAVGALAENDDENGQEVSVLVSQLALLGISPNPFSPAVGLVFVVPAGMRSVSLTIHGVDGRLVCRLVAKKLGEGEHQVVWRGRDDEGRRLPSGVYIARLHAGGVIQLKKMVLVQ